MNKIAESKYIDLKAHLTRQILELDLLQRHYLKWQKFLQLNSFCSFNIAADFLANYFFNSDWFLFFPVNMWRILKFLHPQQQMSSESIFQKA